MVMANFDESTQSLSLDDLHAAGFAHDESVTDLYSGKHPPMPENQIVIPPLSFYWLSE